jgi:HD superfamily phosphodiesterase
LLSSYCKKLFKEVFLPSHDHLHHHRVWAFAKQILNVLNDSGQKIPSILPEQLIIACFFHDTGLTVTTDERHGTESRRLLKKFGTLKVGTLESQPLKFQTILDAVEHHDDKSFTGQKGNSAIEPGLLDILTAADDLDALGVIGIYRYAEIYLLRGITPEELPMRVLSNLKDRMDKFQTTFREYPDFTKIHLERFDVTRTFYEKMQHDISSGKTRESWKRQLINLIESSLEKKVNLMESTRKIPEAEPELQTFLQQIHREMTGI